MKKPRKVNILGTEYTIYIKDQDELQKKLGQKIELDGLCDYQDKIIYIDSDVAKEKYNYDVTLRHEIAHAFFEESGLATQVTFARNEALIDWLALQVPKMADVYKGLGIL